MRNKICINDIAKYSKGQQINRDRLTKCGDYDYLNGGIYPSGKWSKYNVSANTVTISEGGNSSGYVNYMIEPFWCGAHCYYLYDVKGNTKYLYYALKSQQNRLMSIRSGACMPNIKKKDLGAFEFYYDNDQIAQNQIVSILQCIENTIVIRKRELNFIDNIIKARFVEMFEKSDCEKICVQDVCTDIVDCPHSTPKYEGELVHPCIRTSEIKSGYIDWSTMKYVSDNEYNGRISRLRPVPGDIVYGREGTYGNAVILPEGFDFCLGQRVMLFRVDYLKCTSEYLLHALLSDAVKKQADDLNVGATVPHVNVADAKKFEIPFPTMELQKEFTEFAQQVDKSKLPLQNPAYGYSIFLAINRIYAVRQDIKASAAG